MKPKNLPTSRPLAGLLGLAAVAAALALVSGCATVDRTPGSQHAKGFSPVSASPRSETPSGALPSIDEELWVIARATPDASEPDADSPRSGAMICPQLDGEKNIPLPLKHTEVNARIDGHIATVKVTQQFHNPFSEKIEAKYVFPLPQNAAINEFVMLIGERRIRGIIREKHEAEQIYRNAKSRGRVASLLTQLRPNVFTQSVANIEPGKRIDVDITYFNTLAIKDGWHEFVFPMVVGPRFNPPGSSDGAGSVARNRKDASGQATETQYLAPNERSGHDISLFLAVNAGATIGSMESVNHEITQERVWDSLRKVRLARNDRLPNKDFVLRYRLSNATIEPSFTAYDSALGKYFTLTLHPPAEISDSLLEQPLELIFVLDCSGSMSGAPLFQAKSAMTHPLRQLRSDDTFQIIRFSQKASQLGAQPLSANNENVRKGLKHVAKMTGGGGTMMIEGVKAALSFPHDPKRLRFVCFMTDGFIGNETQILGAIQRQVGDSRIFSFGVGSSPHRCLMERMAKLGRGAVAYLGPNDDGAKVMDRFLSRIRRPALTDIEVDWDKLGATEVYPRKIPDLFAGRPVTIVGRFRGEGRGNIRIMGDEGAANPKTIVIPYCAGTPMSIPPGLPAIWARMKIADLMDRSTFDENPNLEKQIKQAALDHNLMSAYTAFVAADASHKTTGKEAREITQAIPTPDGVSHEGAVAQ